MTNKPKTTVRSYRLSDETVRNINQSAAAMRATATEAVRRLSAAMSAFTDGYDPHGDVPLEAYAAAEVAAESVAPEASATLACPLGYGHTAHVWELTGGKSVEIGIYRCGGQPFSNGFDPVDDQDAPVREAVNAAAPHIIELAQRRTYRSVVTRLEGFRDKIDPALVQHFRTLAGPED
jgi:hypothetical protein